MHRLKFILWLTWSVFVKAGAYLAASVDYWIGRKPFRAWIKETWRTVLLILRGTGDRLADGTHHLKSSDFASTGHPSILRLARMSHGLNELLVSNEKPVFRFSILMPVYKPQPQYFEKALRSALAQGAGNVEVLVGFDGPQPSEVVDVVHKLRKESPEFSAALKEFHIDRSSGGGISRTTNALAAKATGDFLLLMDHDDWIRPDLIYRYDLFLKTRVKSDQTVLYCDEYKIDGEDQAIESSYFHKPDRPTFPYIFVNYICHCLLVPTVLWHKAGGLRPETDGAQDFDLSLRLDAVGGEFFNIPAFLYAWRAHVGSTAGNISQKDYATPAGIRALKDYFASKGWNWSVEEGLRPTSYRARPPLTGTPTIQVIIPFREEKEMTFNCIQALMKQKDVQLDIWAVDNGSRDTTIGEELARWGVNVLRVDEPFNYSRLNNLAAQKSQSTFILFLNNDVILENADALHEMAAWADQDKIGIVGARLEYPDGTLQHGGVKIDEKMPTFRIGWSHEDAGRAASELGMSQVTRVCEAVTAACALTRRDRFDAVGGFDEVFFPVAFSDTDLCRRLKEVGLYSLYTPYARGVHHESKSRGLGNIEDVEGSRWYHDVTMEFFRKKTHHDRS